MKLKIPPLALTCVFIAFMSLFSWLFPQFSVNIPINHIIAAVFATAGSLVSALGVKSFRNEKTTVNPTKPHHATSLVIKGIYRISRNPMYLGFLLLLIAWAFFLAHLPSLLLLPTIFVIYMNKFQIPAEEKALQIKFGEDFISYKNSVRRWL